jgi:hypothetical protein
MLKAEGFHPERNWSLREQGVTYQVDLALPLTDKQWLPIMLASTEQSPAPANSLCFPPDSDIAECAQVIRQRIQTLSNRPC